MSKSHQPGRREFLKRGSFAAAAGLLGLGLGAKAATHRHAADGPNQHNMLLVGREAVFLSHLPMFTAPASSPLTATRSSSKRPSRRRGPTPRPSTPKTAAGTRP